ncbi:hypothetical protein EDC04DRAFT_2559804, partial [Pisolithus marmoratus]
PVVATGFLSTCVQAAVANQHIHGSPVMGDISLTCHFTLTTLPPPLSMMETNLYYHSLPSSPKLVACTSTTPWEVPANPEAYCKVKELHVVGNHVLQEVWKDNLALKVHALWDSNKVKWTSTDVIHIGYAGESLVPVIL